MLVQGRVVIVAKAEQLLVAVLELDCLAPAAGQPLPVAPCSSALFLVEYVEEVGAKDAVIDRAATDLLIYPCCVAQFRIPLHLICKLALSTWHLACSAELLICILGIRLLGPVHADLVDAIVAGALTIDLAKDELAKRRIALLIASFVLSE